ncbi:MAG: hypothetical protein QNJ49_09525 [Mastigocoleus sp. MO_167.B18]|nr:hypothetical protein [Mastigocoleus sp. MO_167.B18]
MTAKPYRRILIPRWGLNILTLESWNPNDPNHCLIIKAVVFDLMVIGNWYTPAPLAR